MDFEFGEFVQPYEEEDEDNRCWIQDNFKYLIFGGGQGTGHRDWEVNLEIIERKMPRSAVHSF